MATFLRSSDATADVAAYAATTAKSAPEGALPMPAARTYLKKHVGMNTVDASALLDTLPSVDGKRKYWTIEVLSAQA